MNNNDIIKKQYDFVRREIDINDKYCILLGQNFDDIEAVTIIDILRRAGIELDVYGIGSNKIGSFIGMQYVTDHVFTASSDIDVSGYNGLLLPGGPGVEQLMMNNEILDLVRMFHAVDKLIFAICGAPLILEKAGVLVDKKYTCLPSVAAMIKSGTRIEEKVVAHGNIITSKALGTSMNAALKLVETIVSKEKSDEIASYYYIDVM